MVLDLVVSATRICTQIGSFATCVEFSGGTGADFHGQYHGLRDSCDVADIQSTRKTSNIRVRGRPPVLSLQIKIG